MTPLAVEVLTVTVGWQDRCKIAEIAATLCARHRVARQGSQRWCDTKLVLEKGPIIFRENLVHV